ncbi:hypothetical protein [Nocardia sp. IFM 10818]
MTDNINPAHYQGFSNGAQVIDISEHLTSNGGQALQYIARSTRLDGKNKGNPLEDLRKAMWFIDREVSRLEAVQKAADEAVSARLDEWMNSLHEWIGVPYVPTQRWLLGVDQKPGPRKFDSLFGIPLGVIVRDIDGDEWRWESGGRLTWRSEGEGDFAEWFNYTIEDDESYGPFIEVIESEAF